MPKNPLSDQQLRYIIKSQFKLIQLLSVRVHILEAVVIERGLIPQDVLVQMNEQTLNQEPFVTMTAALDKLEESDSIDDIFQNILGPIQ